MKKTCLFVILIIWTFVMAYITWKHVSKENEDQSFIEYLYKVNDPTWYARYSKKL